MEHEAQIRERAHLRATLSPMAGYYGRDDQVLTLISDNHLAAEFAAAGITPAPGSGAFEEVGVSFPPAGHSSRGAEVAISASRLPTKTEWAAFAGVAPLLSDETLEAIDRRARAEVPAWR